MNKEATCKIGDPTKITNVIGGTPIHGQKPKPGRYPIQIFVEIVLQLIVSESIYGSLAYFMIPKAIIKPEQVDINSPVNLEKPNYFERHETTKILKRSVTVYASIDAAEEEKNKYSDFKIEEIMG